VFTRVVNAEEMAWIDPRPLLFVPA
jgi:hypothetical protein